MLADRHYMRGSAEPELRASTGLMLLTGLCFVIQVAVLDLAGNPQLRSALYLSGEGLARGWLWQLVTFQLLHGNLLHLVFNLLGLFFFGRAVEERMERKRFLLMYFVAGMLGGLVQVLVGGLIPRFGGPVLGASAGVSAVMAAFCVLYWRQHFRLLLFFIIPFEMTGQFLFWFALASTLAGVALGATAPAGDAPAVAHFAHLGGFFAAFLFLPRSATQFGLANWLALRWQRGRALRGASPRRPAPVWQPAPEPEDLPPEEFISREVDPILDKISQQGLQSLTERERRVLEQARAKMSRR